MSYLASISNDTKLLYEIQLYALWPPLPQTSKRLYHVYSDAPVSWQAEYIITRVASSNHSEMLNAALRYPKCSPQVFDMIFHFLCRRTETSMINNPELPRRLFKNLGSSTTNERKWTEYDHPLPFLRHLYSTPTDPAKSQFLHPVVDAYKGYALVRAVHAGFTPLIKFLLSKGANPTCHDGLSIMIAIRKKDLGLVKLLVEREAYSFATSSPSPSNSTTRTDTEGGLSSGNRRKRTDDASSRPNKRRRLADRLQPTPMMVKTAVRCNARDIVQYFVREKGCVPDMETLALMR